MAWGRECRALARRTWRSPRAPLAGGGTVSSTQKKKKCCLHISSVMGFWAHFLNCHYLFGIFSLCEPLKILSHKTWNAKVCPFTSFTNPPTHTPPSDRATQWVREREHWKTGSKTFFRFIQCEIWAYGIDLIQGANRPDGEQLEFLCLLNLETLITARQ